MAFAVSDYMQSGLAFQYAQANCPTERINHASATPFGPTPSLRPTNCRRFFTLDTPSTRTFLWFSATWPSEPARLAAGANHGCEFRCGGLTCRVRASDGLPVELMGFSIEGETARED